MPHLLRRRWWITALLAFVTAAAVVLVDITPQPTAPAVAASDPTAGSPPDDAPAPAEPEPTGTAPAGEGAGPDGAPDDASLRVYEPAGEARGAILVVHGGGWRDVGPARLARVAPWARRFQSLGYEVWSTTYRPGRDSVTDVLAVHDEMRRALPRRLAPCLYGQSAGAHLALMVAARRPGVRGVISAAGPTHLASLPPVTRHLATSAFGREPRELRRFSPLARAGRIRAPLLLEYGHYDRLVPFVQGEALAAARPSARLVQIPGVPDRADGRHPAGWVDWVHGWISPRAARATAALERRWLANHCSAPRRG